MTKTKIRKALQDKYGKRQYRITHDGEIHYITKNQNAPFNNFWAFACRIDNDTDIAIFIN